MAIFWTFIFCGVFLHRYYPLMEEIRAIKIFSYFNSNYNGIFDSKYYDSSSISKKANDYINDLICLKFTNKFINIY